MPDIEPVYKLTILPRGRTGGHALLVPEDDKELMTRSEMLGRLVFAMGGRTAEELVFHEPTTGASSDIEQATKIARAMVTEYGMSARLGAVKYGQEQGDPFLGRSAGRQADYSLEVAHEIDEEVRKLIETAHTEAWHVLSTYRDVLDELVIELLEKETLNRKDLERIFTSVEKRPHITVFNEFGERTPSDKPPIKTPGELAIERGEPWPPPEKERPVLTPAPTPVATVPGGGDLPGGPPYSAPDPNANPYAPPTSGGYANGGHSNGGSNGGGPRPQAYGGQQPGGPAGGYQGGPGTGAQGGPPNYGAPPGWTPATSPGGQPGQPWRPAEDRPRDGWFSDQPGGQGQDEGQHRRDGDGQDNQQR
jgi:cell division protease FtsH